MYVLVGDVGGFDLHLPLAAQDRRTINSGDSTGLSRDAPVATSTPGRGMGKSWAAPQWISKMDRFLHHESSGD